MCSNLAVCMDLAGQLMCRNVEWARARMFDACTYPLKMTPEDKYLGFLTFKLLL